MTADVELLPCGECGMPCRPDEYHPFAACLMFKACHNSETVRANMEALRAEVEEWKRVAAAQAELHDEAERCAERLAETLRELEEREQRDEAMLRQVLEALGRAHQTAMEQTLKARIPECAEFAGIAQDLDFVVAALRERLGKGMDVF